MQTNTNEDKILTIDKMFLLTKTIIDRKKIDIKIKTLQVL